LTLPFWAKGPKEEEKREIERIKEKVFKRSWPKPRQAGGMATGIRFHMRFIAAYRYSKVENHLLF
jgi:hypothetical protein